MKNNVGVAVYTRRKSKHTGTGISDHLAQKRETLSEHKAYNLLIVYPSFIRGTCK